MAALHVGAGIVVGGAVGWRKEVLGRVVAPGLVHLEAQQLVLTIGLHADLRSQLPVDRRGVRGADAGQRWVWAGERLAIREGGADPVEELVAADPAAARIAVDRAFIDAVRGIGDDVRVPYAEALRTHRLACALASSAATGKPARPADAPDADVPETGDAKDTTEGR